MYEEMSDDFPSLSLCGDMRSCTFLEGGMPISSNRNKATKEEMVAI